MAVFDNVRYGEPSSARSLTVSSLPEDIVSQIGLAIVAPPAGMTTASRTVKVFCTTQIPVKIKCDLIDVSYETMTFIVSGSSKTSHVAYLTFPEDVTGIKTMFFKMASAGNVIHNYSAIVNVNFKLGPIGPDSEKMLRLRKFSKDGHISRWDGRKSYL